MTQNILALHDCDERPGATQWASTADVRERRLSTKPDRAGSWTTCPKRANRLLQRYFTPWSGFFPDLSWNRAV